MSVRDSFGCFHSASEFNGAVVLPLLYGCQVSANLSVALASEPAPMCSRDELALCAEAVKCCSGGTEELIDFLGLHQDRCIGN